MGDIPLRTTWANAPAKSPEQHTTAIEDARRKRMGLIWRLLQSEIKEVVGRTLLNRA
jgi:hypothetical protein